MAEITATMVKNLRETTGAPMMACKKALEEAQGDMEKAVEVLRKAGEAKAAKRADKTAAEGKVITAVSNDGKTAFIAEVNSETDFVARSEGFIAFASAIAACGLAAKVQTVEALMNLPYETSSQETVEQARLTLAAKLGENIQVRRVAFLTAPQDGSIGVYCHGDRIGVLVGLKGHDERLGKDLAMHVAANKPQAVRPEDVPADLIAKEKEIFVAQSAESGKPAQIIEKMVEGRVKKFLSEVSLLGQPFVKDPGQTVAELLKSKQSDVSQFIRFEVGEGIEKEVQDFASEVRAQLKS